MWLATSLCFNTHIGGYSKVLYRKQVTHLESHPNKHNESAREWRIMLYKNYQNNMSSNYTMCDLPHLCDWIFTCLTIIPGWLVTPLCLNTHMSNNYTLGDLPHLCDWIPTCLTIILWVTCHTSVTEYPHQWIFKTVLQKASHSFRAQWVCSRAEKSAIYRNDQHQ